MTDAIHPTTVPNHSGSYSELDSLCKLIREEKVILWVGSGFSSYAGYPTGTQLRDIILKTLSELPSGAPDLRDVSLKEVADYYVAAKGRDSLIELLRTLYDNTPQRSDVHELLALINRVKYIVTTNYDPLFEYAYGNNRIVKIAHDEELPGLTDNPEKTVLLKIHGDLSDPGSIIITSDDYDTFDKDSIVWGNIRSLLAIYSVAFIGYSINDPHVEEMLGDIDERLKRRRHSYYFIDSKIDEEKRAHLSSYDLHYIEMDAAAAMNFVAVKTIQFSYLDSMGNSALLIKSDPIFESRDFHVDRNISCGKITHLSLIPTRPDVQSDIKITLTSKTGNNTQFLAFQKFVTGQSFEPVMLTDSDCTISIRGGEMNGVFIFDPAISSYPALSVAPQPSEVVNVDLQLQSGTIRLSKLPMKIFNSEVLLKFEIKDPDFNFTITIQKGKPDVELNFSMHHIVSDIERGRQIYSLFDKWIQGETLELITDRLPAPFLIPPNSFSEPTSDSPPIHALCQLYTDLSDIQRILKVRLTIPDEITQEDQRTIRELVTFLRGRKQKIPEIKATIVLKTDALTPLKQGKLLTLEGKGPIGTIDYSLFGRIFNVPYAVEGFDIFFENIEEILELREKGIKELKVVAKSTTGQLFIRYSPQPVEKSRSARSGR
ncbi:MAG: SIR2 family protein [Methanoregula sp.]|nr:SIR2 family protein [Methanoregula sp.]